MPQPADLISCSGSTGGAALAAEPAAPAQLAHSCCDLLAACCEACVECIGGH